MGTWVVHEKNFTAPIVDGDLELKLSDILAGEDIIFRSLHTGITLSPQGAGAKAPTHRMTDTVTQLGWQTTNSTRDLDVEAHWSPVRVPSPASSPTEAQKSPEGPRPTCRSPVNINLPGT